MVDQDNVIKQFASGLLVGTEIRFVLASTGIPVEQRVSDIEMV